MDECLLRVDTLSLLLIQELKKCPIDRLFLRIACRTADWPANLEGGLKQLWGETSVAVYELAPLRKIDVVTAAAGKELFESIHGFGHHEMASFKSLKENHVADLFIWLARAYPYAEDPKHKGGHWVEPADRLVNLKNSVLQFLEHRGTYQACKEIERLSLEFPELISKQTSKNEELL